MLTFLLISLTTQACPFDEADVEVTVLAHTAIYKAAKSGNFEKASKEIIKNKELYEYFEKEFNDKLYNPLLNASKQEDTSKIKQLLDHSLVLEIKELLGQVDKSFDKYQKSRLLLIKAKKHLKALTSDKKPMKVMKKILKSLGNPGLMGMGKREANKEMFNKNKSILLGIIKQ